MIFPIFIAFIISYTNALSVVSRSQSHPLSQQGVLGPQTSMIIGNKDIAPDGFERS
jgi:iron transport multicopper oxidase